MIGILVKMTWLAFSFFFYCATNTAFSVLEVICQQGGEPFQAENDNSYNFVPVIDIKAKIQK